jgi:hypothetical protein
MYIGVLRLVFQIPGAASLKDRRRVVKSFKDRVKARFPVSIAEVGDLEIGGDLDPGEGQKPNPRILDFPADELRQLLANLIGDAVRA